MEISEERLQELLQAAANQAVAKAYEKPNLVRAKRELLKGKLVQMRRADIIRLILRKLNIDFNTANISTVVREVLELGLKELQSQPKLRKEKVANPRINVRIDSELLDRMKGCGLGTNDLFLFGLFCMSMPSPEERTTAEEAPHEES